MSHFRLVRPRGFGRGLALVYALFGCGGGDKGTSPPPPPDNSPASVTISPASSATLTSGATLTLTATVLTRSGQPLPGATVSWASSDAQVARVEAGVVTAIRVGTAAITASVGAVTSAPVAVTTTPGAPAALGIRTQPSGAIVGSRFAVQPAIEVRDAAGNFVSSSSPNVTVTIGSGGGTLVGSTTNTAIAGVATFLDVGLIGLVGPRVLAFSAPGLAPVSSAPFPLNPGPPASLALARAPVGGATGTPLLVQPIVELRDVAGNLSTGSTATVTTALTGFGASLGGSTTVAAVGGVATFRDLIVNGPIGNYTFSYAAQGLATITSPATALVAILYGLPGERVQILDAGANATVSVSSASATSFLSRAPTRVSVDNGGRFTARAEGQTFVLAGNALGADSILTIVTRTPGGPVARTALGTYSLRARDTTTTNLVLDPRTLHVGGATIIVSLNTQTYSPAWQMQALGAPGVQVSLAQTNPGVVRFTVVASAPITSPLVFGRFTLVNGPPNAQLIVSVTAIDIVAPDGQDLLTRTTSTFYPLTFR